MRALASISPTPSRAAAGHLQAKCAECEKEEKAQKQKREETLQKQEEEEEDIIQAKRRIAPSKAGQKPWLATKLAPATNSRHKPAAKATLATSSLKIAHKRPAIQNRAPGKAPAKDRDCCAESKTANLDNGDVAGVICCDKKKHACLWISGGATGATDPDAVKIIDACGIVHEENHFDDIDCPDGKGPDRPNFKAGKDAAAEEKKSYQAEQKCLEGKLADCGKNASCTKEVKAELKHVKSLA